MRVGWTHSTLARLSLLTADRTLGAIDTPIAPIFCIADPGSSISSIAAGGLIVAEVLGPPGYRENAVSGRCPGYHPPTVIQTRPAASSRDPWPRISYRRLDAFLPASRHIR